MDREQNIIIPGITITLNNILTLEEFEFLTQNFTIID